MSVQRLSYIEKCVECVEYLERALEAPSTTKPTTKCILKNLFLRTKALCQAQGLRVQLNSNQPLVHQWHDLSRALYKHLLQSDPDAVSGHVLHQNLNVLSQLNEELKKDRSFLTKFTRPSVKPLRVPVPNR